jgi:pimeloyl-ACP methyl ester carboxylesterase
MGGDGEPLLLLHGLPGSSQTWQKVGIKIAGRFRVILPDLMGFGASDAPTGDFDVEAQAIAVRALIRYLQIDSLYLGGHGFGAAVAVTLIRLFPEVNVRGLVLSATNLFTDTRIPFPMRVARWPVFNSLFGWTLAGNRLGVRTLYESIAQNKEETRWRDFRHHLTPASLKLTRQLLPRTLAEFPAANAEMQAVLPDITCPVLLLWGDEDPFYTAAVGERLRAALPDALLKVYAYTGHFVPEERPIECAEDIVLRFTGEPLPFKP